MLISAVLPGASAKVIKSATAFGQVMDLWGAPGAQASNCLRPLPPLTTWQSEGYPTCSTERQQAAHAYPAIES